MSANPILQPELWDVAQLGGVSTPGIAEVTGAALVRSWDVRKGYGTSGATTVYTGDQPAKFSLKLTFWLADQVDAYNDQIVPLLEAAPKGAKKALDFYHPAASERPQNIRAVVVEDVGQLVQSGDGLWTVEIKLLQYRAPKAAIGKPAGAAGNKATTPAPSAADNMIAKLTDQLKKLG